MSGFKQWAGATMLIKLLEAVREGGKIDDAAEALDQRLDSTFGNKHSEGIQYEMVESVFLPLSKHLLKEDPTKYKALLEKEIAQA